MPQNLIIFDCGGVLVDSEPMANQVLSERLSAHGLLLSAKAAESHFKGLSSPGIVAKVQSEWEITLPADFIVRLEATVWALLEDNLQPILGIA